VSYARGPGNNSQRDQISALPATLHQELRPESQVSGSRGARFNVPLPASAGSVQLGEVICSAYVDVQCLPKQVLGLIDVFKYLIQGSFGNEEHLSHTASNTSPFGPPRL
jgi:hypothetical protein